MKPGMLAICLGQTGGMTNSELLVGFLGISVLCGYGLWAFTRWFLSAPCQPDPWGKEISAELAEDNCTPLCPHCLSPHQRSAQFCPQCGAAVGAYTNWLPFPRLFSVGQTLRIGTNENFKHSPLVVAGFFVFSLSEYGPFAPVYWFKLIGNLRKPACSTPSEHLESPLDNNFSDSDEPPVK